MESLYFIGVCLRKLVVNGDFIMNSSEQILFRFRLKTKSQDEFNK